MEGRVCFQHFLKKGKDRFSLTNLGRIAPVGRPEGGLRETKGGGQLVDYGREYYNKGLTHAEGSQIEKKKQNGWGNID